MIDFLKIKLILLRDFVITALIYWDLRVLLVTALRKSKYLKYYPFVLVHETFMGKSDKLASRVCTCKEDETCKL